MTNQQTTYSLQQAADMCGMSLNRFRAHKDELISLGATITPKGWSIPSSALTTLGWVGVKSPRVKEATVSVSEHRKVIEENRLLKARIRELEDKTGKRGFFPRRRK